MSGADALDGFRILVVEDEYFLADRLASDLRDMGATVVGLAGTIDDALDLIDATERLDGAVVDVNLHGEMAFPVVDALIARGVAVVFATGYDRASLPPGYAAIPSVQKPVNAAQVAGALTP